MNHNGIFSLSFPETKTIIVSGDIHGNFNQLVFKLCIQYQLTDTLLIVAGDCGFGFEKKGLSGNFWLVSFKISYLCLPLFHETRTTPSCHPSGCAYRQL